MFSNVLVPLDGSPEAATALPAAQALASSLGARISLVRVVRRPDVQFDMHADEIRDAAGYLDGVARELASSNLRVSTHVRSGEVSEAFLQEISARGADLVVMATRGQGGVRRAVLGSVASEVISLSPVPVMLMRAGGRMVCGINNVLVPIDGSPGSALALGAAIDLAHATGAHLTLVNVVAPIPVWTYDAMAGFYYGQHIDPGWDTAALAGARRYTNGLVAQLRKRGAAVNGLAILGDVPRTIVETAQDVSADIVLMSTRGHTGPARAVLGSVADAVLRSAESPVLLIRYGNRRSVGSAALEAHDAAPLEAQDAAHVGR
jgi:nucleotide-binding universal stress UspA family protein